MPAPPVSVVMITRDEERDLSRCLASVAWASEIVVVDCGSADRTVEVARRHGALVVDQPWLGYVAQRNAAQERASQPWILALDADEWLPEETAAEVRRVLEGPRADAYTFPVRSAFAGGFPRGLGEDRHLRLYRKDRGRWTGGEVHETVRLEPGSRVAPLSGPILHLPHRSIAEFTAKMNRYSDLSARSMQASGRPFRTGRLLASTAAAFLKVYVLRRGFLDGMRGLALAVGHAHYTFLKYAKLWERTQRARGPDPAFTRLVPPTPEDPDPGDPRQSG